MTLVSIYDTDRRMGPTMSLRSRRQAAISASISFMLTLSSACRFAVSHDFLSQFGTEGEGLRRSVTLRMLVRMRGFEPRVV